MMIERGRTGWAVLACLLVASVLPTLARAQAEIIRAPEPAWTSHNWPTADFSSGQEYCDAFRDSLAAGGEHYSSLTFALLVYPTETSIPEPVEGKCLTNTQVTRSYTSWALHCPDGFTAQNASSWSNGVPFPHNHFRGDQSYCVRSVGSIDKGKNLGSCRDGTCGVGRPSWSGGPGGNFYQTYEWEEQL